MTHFPSLLRYPILDATLNVWSKLIRLSADNCDIAVEYHLLLRMKSDNKHLYNISLLGYGFSSSDSTVQCMTSSLLKHSLSFT